MNCETEEILKYLDKFRERKEIEKKFNLSNQRGWRWVVYLQKIDMVEVLKAKVEGRKSKYTLFYRSRK